ncbi:MAG: TetR/AcrR family transcriptional regulator [Pseudoruegeria sp.]
MHTSENPPTPMSTKDRLIDTAARLFREQGYHGTGLSEILKQSQTPKGSLYHHFPKGKSDLALAAADWASKGMLQIIDDSFAQAVDFKDGATTLCYKLGKLFDLHKDWRGCPISSMLFDQETNDEFRVHSDKIYNDWHARTIAHAVRLNYPTERCNEDTEALLLMIQGAWSISRARGSADIIRKIPQHLTL